MTRDEWRRAQPVLTQALRLPPEAQTQMIEGAFIEEAIRRELCELLRRSSLTLARMADSGVAARSLETTAAPPDRTPAEPVAPLLADGETLANGRFTVVRQLGRGGMGEVYLAHDTRLRTLVALKVLFHADLSEAQHARQCSGHPHLVTMHDAFDATIGGRSLTILVMEYVAGRPASRMIDDGPVPVRDAIRWVRQVADALAYAHDRGVLHCDLKPANILITPDDGAKVLDFGIGRATFERDRPGEPLRGTAPYMAPEQLLDRHYSPAGDIYSLGVTLFELLTGRLPFETDVPGLLFQVAAEPAPRPSEVRCDLPARLDEIVARTLAKDPQQRYRSARAFDRDLASVESELTTESPVPTRPVPPLRLRWREAVSSRRVAVAGFALVALLTAGTLASRWLSPPMDHLGAITVAPFEMAGSAVKGHPLATALAADLSAALQKSNLVVKGRLAPMTGEPSDPIALAERMGADAVVQASGKLEADRLQLDVGVVQTRTRRELWRRVYETTAADAASLPRSIAADIGRSLGIRGAAVRGRNAAVSLPAYDHYARGRQLAEERNADSLMRSVAQFREAIRLGPEFAAAWAALADVYIALGVPAFGPLRPPEAGARAREAALKALEIDPQLAEAHTSLAFLSYFHDWDWTAADTRFRRALALNPGYATAHHWYADFLNTQARFTEANEHIQLATALEPLSVLFQRDVAWHQFFQRRYGDAIAQLRQTLQGAPNYAPARSLLGRALVQDGQVDEGIAELRRLDLTDPANAAMLAYAYAAAGDRKSAGELLSTLRSASASRYVSPYSIALVNAASGRTHEAIADLQRAYNERDSTIVNINVDPRLDPLRDDVSFQEIVRRMNFPDRGHATP